MINFGRVFNKIALAAIRNKSTIELVAGGIAIVGGTVMLMRDADKIAVVNSEVEYDKAYKKEIDEAVTNSEEPTTWEEEDTEGRSRLKYTLTTTCKHTLAYGKAGWKGLLLIGGGLVLMGMSHADLTAQLKAVTAEAMAQAMLFHDYRQRVRDDVGENKDMEYLTGVKTVEVNENGEVIESTTTVKKIEHQYGKARTPNMFFLDETDMYTGNPTKDLATLEWGINAVNKLLHQKGALTVNEMEHILGRRILPISGQCGGAFAQNKDGSFNYISCGLERRDEATRRFLDGVEDNFLIELKYSDGRPLETNIFGDIERIALLGNWYLS
jgi:hypothetical protein